MKHTGSKEQESHNLRAKIFYKILLSHFGPQGWWPARTQFEVSIGALLTQQATWTSVEKALKELKVRKLLSQKNIVSAHTNTIESCIRPTGFYRQKARRLKLLAAAFPRIQSNRNKGLLELRSTLLALEGVGKETADSILLYAFNRPILPIDAYTFRITSRVYGFDGDYEATRHFYESQLPRDPQVLNEFHALLVELAKRNCKRTNPLCVRCPVNKGCCFYNKPRTARAPKI